MTATTIDDIQSRITQIQQRMGLAASSSAAGTLGSADSSASFQDMLTSALSGTSGGSDSDLSSLMGNGGSVTGQNVVSDATQYLGVPYVWGGTNPATGLDCSGLVQRVYGDLGVSMPRLAADQARQGTPVPSLSQAQPGDLVAFGSPVDHIGIYIGNNQMIVAPHTGDVVKVESVYTTPTAIRRIVPSSDNAGFGAGLSSGAAGFGALSSNYNSLFAAAGAKYGISPTLLAAVAKQESGFNANAKSGAGAQGLMQLMPSTAKSLGVNAFDPSQAVDGAARMLSGLQKQFGSTSLALAAYNAGPGAVQRYGGIPPYAETQNYVKNILAMQQGASV